MTITITIQNSNKEIIGSFPAHPQKSILQSAKEAGVIIPVSCKTGICEICKTRIITGHDLLQIDKITMPLKPLPQDEQGRFSHIFTCTAGVKNKYFQDSQNHEIILEKNI